MPKVFWSGANHSRNSVRNHLTQGTPMKYRITLTLLDGAVITAIVSKQSLRAIQLRKCLSVKWSSL